MLFSHKLKRDMKMWLKEIKIREDNQKNNNKKKKEVNFKAFLKNMKKLSNRNWIKRLKKQSKMVPKFKLKGKIIKIWKIEAES